MCGIFLAFLRNRDGVDYSQIDLESCLDFELIKRRGPDAFRVETIRINDEFTCVFAAGVLSLRGRLQPQPLVHSDTGNVLLWNGELFASDLIHVQEHENDTEKLFESLNRNSDSVSNQLIATFESIKGPYSFVFFEKRTNCIYFGRDRIGRRSLLISDCRRADSSALDGLVFMISSVQVQAKASATDNSNRQFKSFEFDELKANGFYRARLDRPDFEELELLEWRNEALQQSETSVEEEELVHLDIVDGAPKETASSQFRVVKADDFLRDAISPFNTNISISSSSKEATVETLQIFYQVLKQSVARRLKDLPDVCKHCAGNLAEKVKFLAKSDQEEAAVVNKCRHAKVAVLFSGGVDSAVLAALADRCLPEDEEIDLLNVAFEKPRPVAKPKTKEGLALASESDYLVPDRMNGLKTLKELNPRRKWNFVQVNVTLDELRAERQSIIKRLLYPLQTVLDDSIGCAVWFASRGHGQLAGSNEPYQSHAEILLLGMGADEQLAGYARHRSSYQRSGLAGLAAEIKMEMRRISERNLGRDDRIISDHGKESRLPFLDEDVISFLNSLELASKCDLDLPRGKGEKLLLRRLASELLGLDYASNLEKRAIQFGSRVAKLENSKEKASDTCQRIAAD